MNELFAYLDMFWPFLVLIVVFYFFMYRPQKKQQHERARFLASLKKGDHVVTAGGVHGVIKLIRDSYVLLEISPKVVVKVDKAAIQSGNVKLVPEEEVKAEKAAPAEEAEKAKEPASAAKEDVPETKPEDAAKEPNKEEKV